MMLIAPLMLAAVTATQPFAQTAYSGTQPVQVASCDLMPGPVTGDYYFSGMHLPGGAAIRVSFVNRASQPIASVNFAVSDGTLTQQIVDTGTFSRGVTIDHTFTAVAFSGPVNCAVRSVAFADGSTWQAQ
jgi:hypothetical protein